MCGCDYTGTIKGVGPSTSFKLIQDYKTIEKALTKIDSKKIP